MMNLSNLTVYQKSVLGICALVLLCLIYYPFWSQQQIRNKQFMSVATIENRSADGCNITYADELDKEHEVKIEIAEDVQVGEQFAILLKPGTPGKYKILFDKPHYDVKDFDKVPVTSIKANGESVTFSYTVGDSLYTRVQHVAEGKKYSKEKVLVKKGREGVGYLMWE
jgi:hypothetical protein